MSTELREHFETMAQQREAASLGMWAFLATEVMFFGGMFVSYAVYRHQFHHGFQEASTHMNVLLGTINTAVLLTSSLTMALAVHAAHTGRQKLLPLFLILTLLLSLAFLGIKAVEYTEHIRHHLLPGSQFHFTGPDGQPVAGAQMFFLFYFIMTGMHGLHVVIGIGVMIGLLIMSVRGRFSPRWSSPVELGGLYWHFVDVVWIFLFPLFYLIASKG